MKFRRGQLTSVAVVSVALSLAAVAGQPQAGAMSPGGGGVLESADDPEPQGPPLEGTGTVVLESSESRGDVLA